MAVTLLKRKGGGKGTNAKASKKIIANKATNAKKTNSKRNNSNQSGNKVQKKRKKTDGKLEQSIETLIESDHESVEDEDMEFFESNEAFTSFLAKMDTKGLNKPVYTKKKEVRVVQKNQLNKNDSIEHDNDEDMPLEKREDRPRKPGWMSDKKIDLTEKLPVKFMDGSVRPNDLLHQTGPQQSEKHDKETVDEKQADIQMQETSDMENNIVESEYASMSEISDIDVEVITDESLVIPDPEELFKRRKQRLLAKKVELATLCESILENPEDSMKKNKEHPSKLSKMQQLQSLCRDPDNTVRKLSLLSQLSVFLDILPDYRIRVMLQENSEGGNQKKQGRPLKKNVQKLQDFEASLLSNYQKFLKMCGEIVTDGLKISKKNAKGAGLTVVTDQSLVQVAVKCLSELLKKKFAFNFHLNLIHSLIPIADLITNPNLAAMACEAFKVVFASDKSFSCSLEIVKQITAYIKRKKSSQSNINHMLIEIFLSLPLDVTMEEGEAARKRAKADRKKRRKLQSEGDTIAAGLKEAEGVVDKSERNKTQADILHEVVLIYFRLLKESVTSTSNVTDAKSTLLISGVLKGLSKFAFLINLEIMVDLLKLLKAVLKEGKLQIEAAFNAVLTSLKALQGPGQELMVDEKEFVDILYSLLGKLMLHPVDTNSKQADASNQFTNEYVNFSDSQICLPTAISCVELIFLRRKEIVVDRVAAFTKRLLSVALLFQPHQALGIISVVRKLISRYPKLTQLLESDVDRVAMGEYKADIDEPDFANPFASASWELAILHSHYHPAVVKAIHATFSETPILPNESPENIMAAYNYESISGNSPFLTSLTRPPANPLHAKLAKRSKHKANSKRKREREREERFFVVDPLEVGMRPMSQFYEMCANVIKTDDCAKNASDDTINFTKYLSITSLN